MKKTIAILLALAMLFSFAACGTKNEEPKKQDGGEASVQNPWKPYESIDALNEKFGGKIARPGAMGVADEAFTGMESEMGKVAQYDFTLNGIPYTLRFSPDMKEDISGIYVGGKGTIFENVEGDANVATAEVKAARWFTEDGQYCLVANDSKTDAGVFADAADEFRSLTLPAKEPDEHQSIYDNLAGEYQDTFSGRAMLDLEAVDGGVKGAVYWGSSASEQDVWEFTLTVGEGDTFVYEDCKHSRITTESADKQNAEVIAENETGFFTLDQKGDLSWNGAADEACRDCVFEKLL